MARTPGRRPCHDGGVDAELLDLPEQQTATRRAQLAAADLPAFFDGTYGAVWAAAQTQGVAVTGPPFAAYHGMPSEVVDVEAGFPVAGPVHDGDDIRAGSLPSCRAAVTVHVGPYEGLADTWGGLMAWVSEQGLRPAGGLFWEVYLSDPGAEPDPAAWRTQLVLPVA